MFYSSRELTDDGLGNLLENADQPGAERDVGSRTETNSPPHSSTENGDAASEGSSPPLTQPIRTLLSQFCDDFQTALQPALSPIRQATERLANAPEEIPAREILPTLRDIAHQIETLIDKVAEQQAYVLIFGPLKSGKSTFMNAMCAEYVSEVTSLPAYPCMVYVSHAETPKYVVTSYDGSTQTFTDHESLRRTVESAHHDLTERIREVEQRGELFDPASQMPEAIRRIDVKVPAGDLSESGAVLVDTPGLYTRMKFGYDLMTRDFRNTAACAIFVVKTDNLFLEQVFSEFNELLELFSRIFLVVNLDGAKKDLREDGTLVPSLEHEDPKQIVEAFENLAMTAPLKQAADEGRLRIYPVDLLGAASQRIRAQLQTDDGQTASGDGDGEAASNGEDADDGEQVVIEASATPQGQADFDALLGDLTEYLNSNEYLKAFLNDSLRRARNLLDETSEAMGHDTLRHLRERADALEQSKDQAEHRVTAIDRLREIDWSNRLERIREGLEACMASQGDAVRSDTEAKLAEAVDTWFDNDESLGDLIRERIKPALGEAAERLTELARRELEDRVDRRSDRLGLAHGVVRDLEASGLDFSRVAEAGLDEVTLSVDAPEQPLEASRIPVRRRFLDWLLLRPKSAVRRRLFGDPEAPDQALSSAAKQAHLGDRARSAMHARLREQIESLARHASEALPQKVFDEYAQAFARHFSEAASRERKTANDELADYQQRLSEARQILEDLDRLLETTRDVRQGVDDLTERFGHTSPDELSQPVEEPAGPEPSPSGQAEEAAELASSADEASAEADEQAPQVFDLSAEAAEDEEEPETRRDG